MGGPRTKRPAIKISVPGAGGGGRPGQATLDECATPVRLQVGVAAGIVTKVFVGTEIWAVPNGARVEIRSDADLLGLASGGAAPKILACMARGYKFRGRVEGVRDGVITVVLSGET